MADLADGESVEMQGSGRTPYVLKNVGGVFSCSCPAWRNQSVAIERRTCKHLRKLRGDSAETERVGRVDPCVRPSPVAVEGRESQEPPLLLAHAWENDLDLSGWWMSEKLDGVRAYWDGSRFLSRQGNEFHVPDWFCRGLPHFPLDGELWMERMSFQQTVSIVRRQDKSDHWQKIRYLVFDAPQHAEPFEGRLALIADLMKTTGLPHVQAHEHQLCRGLEHLQTELQRVEAVGGEGLMLRQPGSLYEVGRSNTLLKVKTFHDAEAVVVDHVAGKGRHKGRLGALVVHLADGTEFSVGTGFSDKERETPPPVGSTITFRYQELSTGGVPRFPSFVRLCSAGSQLVAGKKPKSPAGSGKIAVTSTAAGAAPTASTKSSIANDGTAALGGAKRYFEFVEGNSSKFWEVSVAGADVIVRFGRIGTQGQSQTKSFPSLDRAQQHADRLITEKQDKGYVEQTGTAE
ncbi:MAG: DNA ligase [Planctomycetes bacterium]|nr:DNA ligase [Planctomycetota bacterium]